VRLKIDIAEDILEQYMMLPISLQILAENDFTGIDRLAERQSYPRPDPAYPGQLQRI